MHFGLTKAAVMVPDKWECGSSFISQCLAWTVTFSHVCFPAGLLLVFLTASMVATADAGEVLDEIE
jgi:hypothetical protein